MPDCPRFVLVDNSVGLSGAAGRTLGTKGRERRQTACKPGSVRRPLPGSWTAIPLGRGSLRASRDQPGRRGGNAPAAALFKGLAGRPYSVLLPVGFALPPPLPGARCALAAPFHPCPRPMVAHGAAGGLFSVALSLGSPPPAVDRHRVPVEPGLSSNPARTGSAAVQPSGAGRDARGRPGRQAGPEPRSGFRPGRAPARLATRPGRSVRKRDAFAGIGTGARARSQAGPSPAEPRHRQ
jgi:hypothetical protein